MSRLSRLLIALGLALGFGLSGGEGPAGPERTGPAVEALTATLAALPGEEAVPDPSDDTALAAWRDLCIPAARGAAAGMPGRAVPAGAAHRTPFARAPPAGLG